MAASKIVYLLKQLYNYNLYTLLTLCPKELILQQQFNLYLQMSGMGGIRWVYFDQNMCFIKGTLIPNCGKNIFLGPLLNVF